MQIHKHELRLRMDAAIGRAPPLTDFELQVMRSCPPGQSWQVPLASELTVNVSEASQT